MIFEKWRVCEPSPSAVADMEERGRSPLAARLLAARGFLSHDEAETVLAVGLDALHDPFLLPDMQKAVDRINAALSSGESIAVYGDYDADGVTATALMVRTLRAKGASCVPYIPDRADEGYGLHASALRLLAGQGIKLVITVDTGITAMAEADLCKELGLDLIITDHHECRDTLPSAAAVINPRRSDSRYPFAGLAGVGVAFKLACALEGNTRRILSRYGDLVAIGTVADIMPVTGENRTLIAYGLHRAEQTKRPGLLALLCELELKGKRISADTISFSLAPRINAAGRVGQAGTALELFLTDDPLKARALAEQLSLLNAQRQIMENTITGQAAAALDPSDPALVLWGDGWPSGVAGIAAARLAAKYDRPVFLICLDEDTGKGSARSARGINLVEILSSQKALLSDYGGHAQAAGFSIPRNNIGAFKEAVLAACAEIRPEERALDIDASLLPEWVTLDGLRSLEGLSPFGKDFAGPVFCLEDAEITGVVGMGGGKHMRVSLDCGGYFFGAVWFGQPPPLPDMGKFVDIAFRPEINRFRGQESVQLQIIDIRPSARRAREGAREDGQY